jgi:catechol 2,3-dioxygenase-like lactoylglutathione lyase family enzyme
MSPFAPSRRRHVVLSDFAVHPSLATADLAAARTWYADKLDLRPVAEFPTLAFYRIGSTIFTVYETPAARTAQNTVAVWLVDDLRSEVERLRARGVVFEDVETPDARTIDGIMTTEDAWGGTVRNAWFRDLDGNWITIVEQAAHPGEPPLDPGDRVGAMLAAADLDRARAWYADRLGLEPVHAYGGDLVYRQGKTHMTIYATPAAGTAKNTVAVWRVGDLRAEMAALRSRGVVFEDDDFGETKSVDGVLMNPGGDSLSAWFKDSEGNILGLVQDLRDPFLAI